MVSYIRVILACFLAIGLSAQSLELVKRIGDDRSEYTFFRVSGAVLGPEKRIYISDAGGYFITAYDWEGRFLKRFGSFGQGPADIQRVRNLQIHGDVLYFVDGENRRLGRLQLDFTPLDPIPVRQLRLRRSVIVSNEGKIWVGLADIGGAQVQGQVVLLDGQGNPKRSFFTTNQFGAPQKKVTDKIERVLRFVHGEVQVSAMPGGSQVLIGFTHPDNPALFYLYTEEGRQVKKIVMKQPKEYCFAKHTNTFPFSYSSDGDRYLYVHLLPGTARGYWVHINRLFVLGDKGGKVKEQKYESAVLIHLDRNGERVAEYTTDPKLEVFSVSDEGYVLSRIEDDETPCLRIYRIPGLVKEVS